MAITDELPADTDVLDPIGRTAHLAAGKARRANTPRSDHAALPDRPSGFDLIESIERSSVDRIPSLVPIRHHRMSVSPFSFFRGTAGLMAADLRDTPTTGIVVQLCGDAHCGNFGAFATPERNVIFDVRDFDETLPGPWEWDVKRLAASLVLAARETGGDAGVGRAAVCGAIHAYRKRMHEFATTSTLDTWYSRVDVHEMLARTGSRALRKRRRTYVDGVGRRTIQKAYDDMTKPVDGGRRFIDEPPIVYHAATETDRFFDVDRLFVAYRQSLSPDVAHLFDRYHLADWVVKVVGVGSVGTRCAAALFLADDDDPLILQMKEAGPSVLEATWPASRCGTHGERVVAGQRIMQAASDLFLGWSSDGGRDYYVRQLRDMKGVPDLEDMGDAQLGEFAKFCGRTLAAAHARSGTAAGIAGYLGRSNVFDDAVADFAECYAERAVADHATFADAIASHRLEATEA